MTALRRAALTAVLAGQTAAWVAGVLPLPLLVLAFAVTLSCAALSARVPARYGRLGSNALALALAAVTVPQVVGAGGTAGLREVLGPLLVGVCAVHALSWEGRRDLQTALVGAGGLLVLGASFAPDILVGAPLLIGVGALLTGGLLNRRERDRASAQLVVPGGVIGRSLAVPAALVGVIGLALFLLIPLPDGAGAASRAAAAAGAGLGGSGRAAPGAYTGDRVDLRVRGELSDRPVLDVPDDSPQLWRSGVYADWDGAGWTADRGGRLVRDGVIDAASGPVRTDRVRPVRRADGVVFAPGPIAAVDLIGPASVDGYGAVRGPTWPEYTVTSQVVEDDPPLLRAATGEDLDDPRWLAVPASVPARVRALGQQLAAGSPSRVDTVLRVQQWLSANATYRLDSPVPAPGEDAVDRFLFVDRIGFCEQFAAAEVLLLRSAGIPARFVTGLGYGESVGKGRRVFRERNLHAWAEVFHPGVGWVAHDPTPPSTQLAGAALRIRVAAQVTGWLRQVASVPGGRPALAIELLGAALLAVAARSVRRRPSRRTSSLISRRPASPLIAAFEHWDQSLGADRRRSGETLAEQAERLGLPMPLRCALQVVEHECYAGWAPDGDRVRESVAALGARPIALTEQAIR